MPASALHRSVLLALAVVSVVALGGCLGHLDSDSTGPETETETDCPKEQVTPVPYPDRPASLTNESVRAFVADLERAYVHTREADGEATDLSFDPEPDDVTRMEDGWSVRVETGIATYSCAGGNLAVGDGHYTARYFVNESAVYRAQDAGDGAVPDPRERGKRIRVGDETVDE